MGIRDYGVCQAEGAYASRPSKILDTESPVGFLGRDAACVLLWEECALCRPSWKREHKKPVTDAPRLQVPVSWGCSEETPWTERIRQLFISHCSGG